MNSLRKITIIIFSLMLVLSMFTACGNDGDDGKNAGSINGVENGSDNGTGDNGTGDTNTPPESNEKEITAFAFTLAENPTIASYVIGSIDESAKTISATASYGTDPTALVASFITTGASVGVGITTQESGITANDFSSPAVYTVTAVDGTTADYTVTLTLELNDAKAITVFNFIDDASNDEILPYSVKGEIDETAKTISFILPYYDYDIIHGGAVPLVATFTTTGESVVVGDEIQESGLTVNDFSSDVVYTVIAEDDTTDDYIVTVTVTDPTTSKSMTSFSFTTDDNPGLLADSIGTIDPETRTIEVYLAGGVSVTNLIATFETNVECDMNCAPVKVVTTEQTSGETVNDFSSEVIYTVTAEDNSTFDYTVTILGEKYEVSGIPDFNMLQAPGAIFPTGGTGAKPVPGPDATVDAFLIGQTEVTLELVAAVYQWAYDEGKFDATDDWTPGTISYRGQTLINLNAPYMGNANFNINDGLNYISVNPTYKDFPAAGITWYGAIMFCNWLTESIYGETEKVYSGITEGWVHTGVVEDLNKTGFRLLSSNEWELGAKYITDDGDGILQAGEYYPGNHVSGDASRPCILFYQWIWWGAPWNYFNWSLFATAPSPSAVYGNYAWHQNNSNTGYDSDAIIPLGGGQGSNAVGSTGSPASGALSSIYPNALGLFDMSGNVAEWVFDNHSDASGDTPNRIVRDAGWRETLHFFENPNLRLGNVRGIAPTAATGDIGFRLGKNAPE